MSTLTSEILAICAGISIIGGAIVMLVRFFTPILSLGREVEENSRQIASIKQKLGNDYQLLQESEKADKLICRTLLDITNHMIFGNHVDEMKTTRKELLDFLSQ